MLTMLMLAALVGCGTQKPVETGSDAESTNSTSPAESQTESTTESQTESGGVIVVYFSCTGHTKPLALCDYYLDGKTDEHSRHLYDILKMLPIVKIDENLKQLFLKVRAERKEHKTCISAIDDEY